MKALVAELVVRGNLPRKSNSRMIVKNPKTDKLMVIKSELAQQYVDDFEKQIPGDLKMGWGSLKQSRRRWRGDRMAIPQCGLCCL